jgi:transposase
MLKCFSNFHLEIKVGETKKRGRTKQTPPINLLIRLKDFKSQVVRMLKVKQKVSSRIKFLLRKNFILEGCFRTLSEAEQFGRARGYISTARKNAVNIFKAIKDAFGGKPFIPEA